MIPAENKREKALELAKEGKGAAEIARLIDAKYSTVYSWLNPDKCKKPKPESKTASNAEPACSGQQEIQREPAVPISR